MTINEIEGGRAQTAYTAAQAAHATLPPSARKEYVAYVKRIPMMIRDNGLGNTFAFVLSSAKKGSGSAAYDRIDQDTLAWLKAGRSFLLGRHGKTAENVSDLLVRLNQYQYAAVTEEVMSYFDWLRRYAEGLATPEPTAINKADSPAEPTATNEADSPAEPTTEEASTHESNE